MAGFSWLDCYCRVTAGVDDTVVTSGSTDLGRSTKRSFQVWRKSEKTHETKYFTAHPWLQSFTVHTNNRLSFHDLRQAEGHTHQLWTDMDSTSGLREALQVGTGEFGESSEANDKDGNRVVHTYMQIINPACTGSDTWRSYSNLSPTALELLKQAPAWTWFVNLSRWEHCGESVWHKCLQHQAIGAQL